MTDKLKKAQKKRVIEKYKETGQVVTACAAVKLSRITFYDWLKRDPKFKEDFDNANFEVVGLMEDEAKRRGMEGIDEPVFHRGEQCGVIRRYSDQLLITLLKAHAPEKYRNNVQADITTKGQAIGKIIIEDVEGDTI